MNHTQTRRTQRTSALRLDLGIRDLLPEWKDMLSPRYLRDDAVAGLTVACVAIPLSLAIALASGVAPEVGLVTAIVAGIVAALFNGTPLAVSGPAAAMAVLIATAVADHGLGGLLVIGVVTGVLQLLTGVLGLGKLIRFVPVPVVAGFTAGIGAIILIGQLPRAFGLPLPEQSHVTQVFTHLGAMIGQANGAALGLCATTLAIAIGLPKVMPKLPAPLFAVIVPTVAAVALGLDVETIGALPAALPMPQLPTIPSTGIAPLLGTAFVVYVLASLETLLSSGAVDKLAKGRRHDPDQELVGQGLGNAAVALFGGIPITGVIARSALNVQAGAKTRRAAIFHALVLVAAIYVFAPVMARIPIAALAGVLLSVALRMLHPRELMGLWKVSRSDAVVYAVTFVVIVAVDLIAGVQAGIVAALGIAAIRLGQTRWALNHGETSGPHRFVIDGPLTFLSSAVLEKVRQQATALPAGRGVILDVGGVTAMDTSGSEMLAGVVESILESGHRVVLLGLRPSLEQSLRQQEHGGAILGRCAVSASDALRLVDGTGNGRERLVQGVELFRRQHRDRYRPLFDKLAGGQAPHTLLITCSDSRINPNLITSTDPGELFMVRNVGNLVPHADSAESGQVGSAIEYAVGVLGVSEIVVCGHSGCGAMNALLTGGAKGKLPNVESWLQHAEPVLAGLPADATPEQAAMANALLQIENARSYPLIREKLASGELRLHAWFYDVGHAELQEWDEARGAFVTLGHAAPATAQEGEELQPLQPVTA